MDVARLRIAVPILAVAAVFFALSCVPKSTLSKHAREEQALDSHWQLTARKKLAANELWKEHDGGDQVYLQRGCVSETMLDYRHRNRPWAIRCSIFEHKDSAGARSLFEYYREEVDNELSDFKPIGEASYLWKSQGIHCWVLGFYKGNRFVEVSLTEEKAESGSPLGDSSREALLDFARRLAQKL